MSNQNETFTELFTSYFEKLDLYTNAITKAHGASHPETFEIRKVFEAINEKVSANNLELDSEFGQLRQVTDNYTIPADVCGTYAATYNMLSQIDEAWGRF